MNIFEVKKEEYKTFVVNPFFCFYTIDFIELNKHKVRDVKYFIFENNKKRFGLVGGIKDGILKFPFSATFCCLSEIAHNNKISHYHDAIKNLIDWSKFSNIKTIRFNTPPVFYNSSHITKLQNALFCNGFKLLDYDVNFQFKLEQYDNYDSIINTDSRRNLKIAAKNNLTIEKSDDVSKVYEIIKINREEKNFPLWMSENDIINTANIIKSDYFLIKNENEYIASAYIQHITKNIVNVVYWGNLQKYDKQYPMNFLAKNIFEYYSKQKNIEYISIGTSTLDSNPNFGLCDFKESIGCNCCPKLNFYLDI